MRQSDFERLKVGDRIKFKCATIWNCGAVVRKIWSIDKERQRVNVTYGGWNKCFVVKRSEIIKKVRT